VTECAPREAKPDEQRVGDKIMRRIDNLERDRWTNEAACSAERVSIFADRAPKALHIYP
jgi:hypothetical protein